MEYAPKAPARTLLPAAFVFGALRQLTPSMAFIRLVTPEKTPEVALEHVTASGGLVDNGYWWLERLAGVEAEGILETATLMGELGEDRPAVVALDPRCWQGDLRQLRRGLGKIPTLNYVVVGEDHRGSLTAHRRSVGVDGSLGEGLVLGHWRLDDSLRLAWSPRDPWGLVWGAGHPLPARREEVALLVVGESRHLFEVYPAVIGALGDAAEVWDAQLALRLTSGEALAAAANDQRAHLLRQVGGVFLPGGADPRQVEGQIRLVETWLDPEHARVPLLGACWGMQTLITAMVRRRLHQPAAHLPEVEPAAAPATFIPLGYHRLGALPVDLVPGSHLQRCWGSTSRVFERFNHRHVLDQTLLPALNQAGLRVAGWGEGGQLVDAVELPKRAFAAGLASHPELLSRRAAPHPVIKAFVAAARRRTAGLG
ncbi:MAG: gamma-glutamyl-gamma-aminobutyrate hydrolase family protein [Candidatus Competibacterales bacterium]